VELFLKKVVGLLFASVVSGALGFSVFLTEIISAQL
jgi:hypothetical protein